MFRFLFMSRRISYFTGKSAPGEVERRKSGQEEDRHDHERRQNNDSGSNSRNQDEHDATVAVNCSSQARQSVFQDFYPTNASLTTPLCWSKHAALLGDVVGANTTNDVVKWNFEQVGEFLAKFGIISPLLERFKEEVCLIIDSVYVYHNLNFILDLFIFVF